MSWRSTLARRVLSHEAVAVLRSESSLFLARLRCFSPLNLFKIFMLRRHSALNLVLGSGPTRFDGWISVDLFPPPSGVRWDLRWSLPFATVQVDAIHCEHFLEHLSPALDVETFLSECRRVLKPDSHLRVIVPDGERYMRAYVDNDSEFFANLRHLGGASDPFVLPIEVVNQMFRMGGGHQFAYDFKMLETKLRNAGFKAVSRSAMNSVPDFPDLQDSWREVESVYVMAA